MRTNYQRPCRCLRLTSSKLRCQTKNEFAPTRATCHPLELCLNSSSNCQVRAVLGLTFVFEVYGINRYLQLAVQWVPAYGVRPQNVTLGVMAYV